MCRFSYGKWIPSCAQRKRRQELDERVIQRVVEIMIQKMNMHGVDNFFVVGEEGGLYCHAQFCDHSYLLLDYHCGSGVIN